MREAFRPFAPAVTLREAPRWFDIPAGTEMPYMITTVDVRREYRNQLPAITHADGSAVLRASRLFLRSTTRNSISFSRPWGKPPAERWS